MRISNVDKLIPLFKGDLALFYATEVDCNE